MNFFSFLGRAVKNENLIFNSADGWKSASLSISNPPQLTSTLPSIFTTEVGALFTTRGGIYSRIGVFIGGGDIVFCSQIRYFCTKEIVHLVLSRATSRTGATVY